jgi:hypothetical protein
LRLCHPGASGIPDWTDASAYAPLLRLERAGFAWEWLRRRRDYAAAAHRAINRGQVAEEIEDEAALAWNLHAFENPDLAAPGARPVWTAAGHPWVVQATARASRADEDGIDLEQLGPLATLVRSTGMQRLLLSDGYRSIRLDLIGSDIGRRPLRLSYELAGIEALERPLLVLRRLRALAISGRFRPSLHPRVRRAHRLIQLLRTHDAFQAGATQADIAQVLLRSGLERSRWRIHSPSIRSQAQRMVVAARQMSNGAFWRLLE